MADHSVDEVLAAVQAADAGADSIIAFAATLKAQLNDALGRTLTPEQQAKLNQVFDIATNDATKIAAAVNAPAV